MRRLDLADYESGGPEPFQVGPSLANVLFNEKRLDAREVIRRDELARRIEAAGQGVILLEEAEWQKCVNGLNATDLSGLGRSVVEFCRRIMDAPEVDVQEAVP